jgi:phospholipase/carboxylesterase
MTEDSAIVLEPDAQHRHSVIWLHGLGADGSDFLPLVAELALPPALGIRWIFPHAPVQPVTINGRYRMRAWYDIAVPDLTAQVDTAGIRRSRDRLLGLMADEQAAGVSAARIVLAGFSQGGVIALSAALAAPNKPAGVLALSTYLPLRDPPSPGELQVLQAHGEYDDIVPQPVAEQTRDYLQGLGVTLDWRSYPMAHSLCAAEVTDIRGWLLARLGGATSA